jgi:hypothetical protein
MAIESTVFAPENLSPTLERLLHQKRVNIDAIVDYLAETGTDQDVSTTWPLEGS